MDIYRPITELSGRTFSWQRVKRPQKRVELRCGNELVGTLVPKGLTESRVVAAAAGGEWLLVRRPPRSFRIEVEDWTAFAADPSGDDDTTESWFAWRRGRTVKLADGLDLRWGPSGWFSGERTFSTRQGATVLAFRGGRELIITVGDGFQHLPFLPLLMLMGWHQIVLSEEVG